MSVHQYIGARYVPYYYENSLDPTSCEWEPNVNYEALTVVTLPNQHSYISKKAVPDTIGSPALNAEYWLDTGYDNAYIQALQDQIDDMNDGSVAGSLQNQINEMQDGSVAGSLQNQINTKVPEFVDRHYIFLGDSYDTLHAGYSWIDMVAQYIGIPAGNYEKRSAGGHGFYPTVPTNTWTNYLIANPVSDPDAITDIVICGGANDVHAPEVDLYTGMHDFDTYVRAQYPNLKRIYLGFIGWQQVAANRPKMVKQAGLYRRYGVSFGWRYINGVENIMKNPGLIDLNYTDYQHPTTGGVEHLGFGIADALMMGTCEEYARNISTYTPYATDIALNAGQSITLTEDIRDGMVTVAWSDISGSFVRNVGSIVFTLGVGAENMSAVPCNKFLPCVFRVGTDTHPAYLYFSDVKTIQIMFCDGYQPANGAYWKLCASTATLIIT